nr:MAG TPA: hypothetical protein [Caudoviricetes sp.]
MAEGTSAFSRLPAVSSDERPDRGKEPLDRGRRAVRPACGRLRFPWGGADPGFGG